MKRNHYVVETLLYPFQAELLEMPACAFFLRGEWAPCLSSGDWKSVLRVEQTLKQEADDWVARGFEVLSDLDGTYPVGMCLLTKHKKENYGNIARAWDALEDGGVLVCVGSNDIGAKSIEKNIRKVWPLEGGEAKNHCRVFWLRKTGEVEIPDEWRSYTELAQNIKGETFYTQPGVY
ncbi:MAG: hypothetical protein AAF226_11905, partial [Verrucomicrobiota bacterium]